MSREINAGLESEADTSALELFDRSCPWNFYMNGCFWSKLQHTAPPSPEHTLNDPGSQGHSLKARLLQAGSTYFRLQLYMGLLHVMHHVK